MVLPLTLSLPVLATGGAVGVGYGLFGAGGSAIATPVLALLGVPPLLAVATPLPATIPAAIAGAWSYGRQGLLDRGVIVRAVAAGVPAALLGAACSALVGGRVLLLLSGALLVVLGARTARARAANAKVRTPLEGRRKHVATIAGATAVGFTTGLLANSGGFLLVPLFVLVLGLGMRTAAGTSLVVAAGMSIPTVLAHWALGDINWAISAVFAVGLIPGSVAGSRLSSQVDQARTQTAFGIVLLVFGSCFLIRMR